jgi:prepilin-type processing-associated H-X9-DG protein
MLGDGAEADWGIQGYSVFRHPFTACNYAYMDGHVESLSPSRINASTYINGWGVNMISDPRIYLVH